MANNHIFKQIEGKYETGSGFVVPGQGSTARKNRPG